MGGIYCTTHGGIGAEKGLCKVAYFINDFDKKHKGSRLVARYAEVLPVVTSLLVARVATKSSNNTEKND